MQVIQRNVRVTMHDYRHFERIQISSNLNLKLFRESLHPQFNTNSVFKAGEGAGRSGSFFFFSHDNRFIIKTMSTEEMGWLHQIMPQYVNHFIQNPTSLIAKIFGTFTVQIEGIVPVKVLLMENTL